jgi:hypothetical protein
MRAAYLFLSLEQHFYIAGEGATAGKEGFEGHELGEVLAFIVADSACLELMFTSIEMKEQAHTTAGDQLVPEH